MTGESLEGVSLTEQWDWDWDWTGSVWMCLRVAGVCGVHGHVGLSAIVGCADRSCTVYRLQSS